MTILGVLGWAVGGVLAVWFLVSVIGNVRRWRPALTAHDVAGLVPNWALFARPRTHDVVLLQREVLADGSLTRWRELEVDGPRPWYAFLWNPGLGPRRAMLALGDMTLRQNQLRRQRGLAEFDQGTAGSRGAMTSVPYLVLLHHVSSRAHAAAVATQFMLVAVTGQVVGGRYDLEAEAEAMFVSELHSLGRLPARANQD